MAENVYASAKIVQGNDNIKKFELANFKRGPSVEEEEQSHFFSETKMEDNSTEPNLRKDEGTYSNLTTSNKEIIEKIEPIYSQFESLSSKIDEISQKIYTIEKEGALKNKELDEQVVKAIKDLKQYASFFEQASLQLESKILKTSIAIAQKIINIEVAENSSKIAKQTINQLLNKIKGATKVRILLNPKDFYILKKELELEPFIELVEDSNVVAGGVVIASNVGNFDGTIEAKVSSMLESLDLVI